MSWRKDLNIRFFFSSNIKYGADNWDPSHNFSQYHFFRYGPVTPRVFMAIVYNCRLSAEEWL